VAQYLARIERKAGPDTLSQRFQQLFVNLLSDR